ncbi:hypothetical protein ES705_19302 [subsurface metagenome]
MEGLGTEQSRCCHGIAVATAVVPRRRQARPATLPRSSRDGDRTHNRQTRGKLKARSNLSHGQATNAPLSLRRLCYVSFPRSFAPPRPRKRARYAPPGKKTPPIRGDATRAHMRGCGPGVRLEAGQSGGTPCACAPFGRPPFMPRASGACPAPLPPPVPRPPQNPLTRQPHTWPARLRSLSRSLSFARLLRYVPR